MKPPRDDGEARLLKRLTVHRKAKSQLGTPTSRAGETTPGSTGPLARSGPVAGVEDRSLRWCSSTWTVTELIGLLVDFRPQSLRQVRRARLQPEGSGVGAAGSRRAKHVAVAEEANFEELVDCLVADCGSELERSYRVELAPQELDELEELEASVRSAEEVLLILDRQVLTSCLLCCSTSRRLRVTSPPETFRGSASELLCWEQRLDGLDWQQLTAKGDAATRKLRTFAEQKWDLRGIGTDRLLSQLKVLLRRYIYGQILLKAVQLGDLEAVEAALERGASLDQRDADGNTLEDLARFCNHEEIEEFLFERRMQGMIHQPLSHFFRAEELIAQCSDADPTVLMPFMTQNDGEGTTDDLWPDSAAMAAEEEDQQLWDYLAAITGTPGATPGAVAAGASVSMPFSAVRAV
ncbi:unnamed protein product [Durusdinium trenchii]|uniref:Uncharacterized protein n=1 Tax=Durusdinium trenchii TaxID=1381693 RepID=A0ABP0NWX8_9DINO